MNLKQLQQQIENDAVANVYVVTGEEDALLASAYRLFQSLIADEDRDMNLAQFDLSEVNLDTMINDAMSMPFFGNKRVTIVDNPQFLTATAKVNNHDQELLLKLLQQPNAENVIVFFVKQLKLDKRKKITKLLLKQAEIVDLPLLSEKQSQQAIAGYLSQRNYQMTPEAMTELLKRTNANYSNMLNEMPKLLAFAHKAKKIELSTVQALVPKTLTANVFDLVNYVIQAKVEEALVLYRDLLLSGEAPLRLNAVLTSQFRLLLQVAGLQGNDNDISKQLGVHPYRIKLAKQSLRQYKLYDIRNGYLKMLDIEIQLKTTQHNPERLFELFVMNFSK